MVALRAGRGLAPCDVWNTSSTDYHVPIVVRNDIPNDRAWDEAGGADGRCWRIRCAWLREAATAILGNVS